MPTITLLSKKRTNQNKKRYLTDIYNCTRWRKLRLTKLAFDPLCERCKGKDIITAAEEVHHIVAFSSADDKNERIILAYDYDNLMSLCSDCHSYIHSEERKKTN